MRSAELTLPGFRHDVCSAIHPLALASPFLRRLPLADHGLAFAHPEIPLAHPLDDGSAVALHRSVDETAAGLGADAESYRDLMTPLAEGWELLVGDLLGPLRLPRHPHAERALRTRRRALGRRARARPFHGRARASAVRRQRRALPCARSRAPPPRPSGSCCRCSGTASAGRPPSGGSQAIADAMASLLRSLGGEIRTGSEVRSLADVRGARAVLLDLTPRQVLAVAGDALPARYRRALGALPLRARRLQARLRARRRRCPGRRRSAAAPGRSTSAARSRRSPAPRPRSRAAGMRRAPTCWSPSRASSTPRAPRRGRTRCGPTATCPMARRSTHARRSRARSSVSRRASATSSAPAARCAPRSSRRTTPTTSAATSTAARPISASSGRVRRRGACPTRRPIERLFICSSSTPPGGGVHGDVRLARGARGAARRPALRRCVRGSPP